jgi:hypothetical protein
MQAISGSVPTFVHAIETSTPIYVTTDGQWRTKGVFERIWSIIRRTLFGYDEAVENAKRLAIALTKPTIVKINGCPGVTQNPAWSSDKIHSLVQAVKATLHDKATEENRCIRALSHQRDAFVTQTSCISSESPEVVELNRKIFSTDHWVHRHTLAMLDRAELAHRYLGMDQSTIDAIEPRPEDVQWLSQQLLDWQRQQFPAIEYLHGPNHQQVMEKIKHCCRYKDVIEKAKTNGALLELCFQSVFKRMPDNFTNAMDTFVQTPRILDHLKKSYIDTRIRELANEGIKFEQIATKGDGTCKPIKDVKLLMNGTLQSISDLNHVVTIAAKVQKTVKAVFDEFEAQNFRFISMEYLQEAGVTLFDPRLLHIDLNTKEWWKSLPILRRMTREQIERTYGVSLKDQYGLALLRASRASPTLSADSTHGWLNMIYPLEDGTYNVVAAGKYSDQFPVTLWEKFCHIFCTHRAYITVFDFNEFLNNRERTFVSLPIETKESFEAKMEDLRKELLRSRKGELVFQAQGDNCATWCVQFVLRNWPGLNIAPYYVPFYKLKIPTPFTFIVAARKWFPTDSAWQVFRRLICSLLGARRSRKATGGNGKPIDIRLTDNLEWYRGMIHLPSQLWFTRGTVAKQVAEYQQRQTLYVPEEKPSYQKPPFPSSQTPTKVTGEFMRKAFMMYRPLLPLSPIVAQ